MALVRGRYYQHSIRIHKRVTTEYYGVGSAGASWEATDALVRQAREERWLAVREERDRLRRAYQAELRRGRIVRSLAGVYLEARGFVFWNHTQWRRRRMGSARTLPAVPRDDAEVKAEMKALVRRIARDRDDGAIAKLRALAEDYPQAAAAAIYCDLPRHARRILATELFNRPEDEPERDALIARMAMTAEELAGPSPTPEVRLLAELAGYEWARGWLLTLVVSTREGFRTEHPILTRRRGAAAKDLAYLVKTLARIKQLQRPVVVAAAIHLSGQAARNGLPSPP
jgi:hypothetical protein